jgi:hypothetical protein
MSNFHYSFLQYFAASQRHLNCSHLNIRLELPVYLLDGRFLRFDIAEIYSAMRVSEMFSCPAVANFKPELFNRQGSLKPECQRSRLPIMRLSSIANQLRCLLVLVCLLYCILLYTVCTTRPYNSTHTRNFNYQRNLKM